MGLGLTEVYKSSQAPLYHATASAESSDSPVPAINP